MNMRQEIMVIIWSETWSNDKKTVALEKLFADRLQKIKDSMLSTDTSWIAICELIDELRGESKPHITTLTDDTNGEGV